MPEVTIIGYDDTFAREFGTLNYEWIAKSYAIENHDRDVLDHPGNIIAQGGQIFFAIVDGAAIGTVALIPMGDADFELTKMAVAPESRGLGIGEKLMTACIGWAEKEGKSALILESNTKQAAAIRLYKKFGFVEILLDPYSEYERANIRMKKDIG